MSTKSDIIWDANDIRVYTDCSCHRMQWGRCIGDDMFVVIDKRIIKQMKVLLDEQKVTILFTHDSEAFKSIGCCMHIPCYDIDYFELDDTDLQIIIKGGSTTAKKFERKVFV